MVREQRVKLRTYWVLLDSIMRAYVVGGTRTNSTIEIDPKKQGNTFGFTFSNNVTKKLQKLNITRGGALVIRTVGGNTVQMDTTCTN